MTKESLAGVTSVTLTSDRSSPAPSGTLIRWTATATGGTTPRSYKWWLWNGSTWQVLRDWNTSATYSWTPTTPNSAYRVKVGARSAGNAADVAEAVATSPYFPISLPPRATSVSLTPSHGAPQAVGTPIRWTAQASGGVAPHSYKWLVFDGNVWKVLREWNTSPSYDWSPTVANNAYRVGVWVRSAGNPADAIETSTATAFGILPKPLARVASVTLTSDRSSPEPTGSTITWTAHPSGGAAPYTYKWWVWDGVRWHVLRDWTASATYAWAPTTANSGYRFGVWARSAGNSFDDNEASTTVSFVITAAGSAPEGTADCLRSVDPAVVAFGSGGGAGSARLDSDMSNCTWEAVSQSTWIVVTSTRTGTGDATVTFTTAANDSTVSRTGSIKIGAKTLSITQAGVTSSSGCTYAVFPTALEVGFGNETANVAVTAPDGCAWTASVGGFAHVNPGSGSGSATLTVSIENNTAPEPRATVLTVAGRAVTITQAGREASVPECTYSVSPSDASFDFHGGSGTVQVSAPSGCDWTVTGTNSFVHLNGASSGSGSGSVSYVVDVNGTSAERSGLLMIAGQSVTITQGAVALVPPCTFTLSWPSIEVSYAGGSASVGVFADAGCQWDVVSHVDWIRIDGMSGPGNGAVWMTVEGNSGSSRAATVVVAGQPFTISQGEAPVTADPDDITWHTPPDDERVGQCEGNCGAGCSSFFNPCSGPHYWEHSVVSTPQYVGDDWEPVCSGGTSWFTVRPRFIAVARWTFHGLKSLKCEEHDATCRNLNFIPFLPVDKIACLVTAGLVGLNGFNYCEGAEPFDWSYEFVDVGHGAPVAFIDGAPSCE